jgi:hypothetical protein
MIPALWTKQPAEKRKLKLDAANSLISGDTIASCEVKVFNAQGQDLSATMLAGVTNDTTAVYAWVQAGATATIYYLRVKITTTLGEIIEDDLAVKVQQKYQ